MTQSICEKFGSCGGCPNGGSAYSEQLRQKASPMEAGLGLNPSILSLGESRLRDRVELVWQTIGVSKPVLGLFRLDSRDLIDIDACPMLSEPLEAWLKDFRQLAPPIGRGTVRLRVSPTGERGAWLDFANVDVKTLFEEINYLRWLSDRAIVEIGQRRKRLVWRDEKPKLVDAELFPWFVTYGAGGRSIPLYGVIGGFTQVGFSSNRALVDKVVEQVRQSGVGEWVELFCGSGNFSLALADNGFSVAAYENDEIAVSSLQRSIAELGIKKLHVTQADVYRQPKKIVSLVSKGLLVDPPRSGLGQFLTWLDGLSLSERPKSLVYVSCFSDSFVSDTLKLQELGYKISSVEGVDQFPHSIHMEWVARLSIL